MPSAHTVVIGGGLSGLAAAYYLAQGGIHPVLLEPSGRFGGLVGTQSVDDCRLEQGPDSFLATKPEMRELARELGIEHLIIPSNDGKRRVYIAHRGKLVPMPEGMVMMAPGDLKAALRSNVFSLPTKLSFLRENWAQPRSRTGDVSVADFVLDHFNRQVLDVITEPLLTGVYGGSARQLSMQAVLPRFLDYERELGSTIRGATRERSRRNPKKSLFESFSGGMQTVIDALVAAIQGKVDILPQAAIRIARASTHWLVTTAAGSLDAEKVILATPAHVAGRLLRDELPPVANLLSAIPYSSALLVTNLYDSATFTHPLNGFGFLIPATERSTVAAATWINSKFPSRVAPDRVAIRSFIVADQAVRLEKSSDPDLAALVDLDLRRWMSLDVPPLKTIVSRWPSSMPQYTVGHLDRMQDLDRKLAQAPGLFLCGNAYSGVGLSDCIRTARQAAHSALRMTNS